MDELVRKVYDTIKESGMICQGDSVIIGVSGGADSVCLLSVLKTLQPTMDLMLTAVHIHHGLRGEAADRDRDFVIELCQTLQVPCECFQADIREMARVQHLSEEEAGRIFRYECFEKVRQQKQASKIAVAHHMDDQAETVLLNLFRGSGLKGIAGIPAVRGAIVRPLLKISRSDIEEYLRNHHIIYMNDATNFETEYTRNRIRLDILPYVTDNINPAAAAHIAETAAIAANICHYIEKQAEAAGKTMIRQISEDNHTVLKIDAAAFISQDIAIQRELLRQVMHRLAGGLKDIRAVHIEMFRMLFYGHAGRQADLPYNLCAKRMYTTVDIFENQTHTMAGISHTVNGIAEDKTSETQLMIPGNYIFGSGKRQLCLEIFPVEKNLQIPKKMYTKWFDYDRIKNGLVLRQRQPGDYMVIGGGHKKSLRRILMDDKVPQSDRENLNMLTDGSHVLWIPDIGRMSEYYKITGETKLILSAELKEIEE